MPLTLFLIAAWGLVFAVPMMAQELAGPTTEVTPHAPLAPDGSMAPIPVPTPDADTGKRLPFEIGLSLSGYFDDNIYVQPAGPNRVSDFIWTIAPLISWSSSRMSGMENSVQIAYSPGFVIYQDHPANNTFEQIGSFVYGYQGPRSQLTVNQQYASVQNSGPDLGELVKLNEYLTTINFDYAVTAKLGLTLRAEQQIIDYDEGFNSSQWTGSAYLTYEAMPKTSFALGLLGGAVDLEGPNQTFEQFNGRVVYTPTTKLSFNLTLGVECRQTEGTSRQLVKPVFSGGLDYEPFDATSLNLNAYRNYSYSATYYGNDYLATGVSGSITQRFFNKIFAVFTASFENASYEDNVTQQQGALAYNFFSLRPSLSYRLADWCQLSVFYQYRENVSQTIDAFTDNQVGFESRFTY
jgi:hypothetical protein